QVALNRHVSNFQRITRYSGKFCHYRTPPKACQHASKLLSNAKRGKYPGQHVLSSSFTSDLAEVSKRIVQANKGDLLARFGIEGRHRFIDLAGGAGQKVVMTRVGNKKAVGRRFVRFEWLDDSKLQLVKTGSGFGGDRRGIFGESRRKI